jgi:hypothetical protein
VGILVFFVAGGGSLCAGGSQEEGLDTARRLIAEKRYNEALLVLTEVIRGDPEKTAEAENLIRQVRLYREAYSDRYEELIRILYEERDVVRALALVRELEALDPNPNPATVAALEKARESAQFIYEQQEFARIMDAALALLGQGEYWQACAMYEEAIGLGRERFDRAGYGNVVRGRVDAVIDSVRRQAGVFRDTEAAQRQALGDIRAAAQGSDAAAFQAAIARYGEIFRPVARLAGGSLSAVSQLQAQNDIVLDDREDIFLAYTERLIGGRPNSRETEGIKGAAQRVLESVSGPAADFLCARAALLLEEGRAAEENREWAVASARFAEAGLAAGEARRVLDLWFEALPARGAALSAEGWKVAVSQAPLFLRVSAMQGLAEGRSNLVGLLAGVGQEDVAGLAAFEELAAYRRNIVQVSISVDSLRAAWRASGAVIADNPLAPEDARDAIGVFRGDLDAWAERMSQLEVRTVDRMAEAQLVPITEGLAGSQADYRRGVEFATGVRQQAEGEAEARVAFYPAQALTVFAALRARLDGLEGQTRGYVNTYSSEESRFTGYPGIAQKLRDASGVVAEIQGLRSQIPAMAATARANVLQAERYKSEGTLRLNETQAAIAAGNFEAARRAIAAARQGFSNSLALQDDEELRSQSDERLFALNSAMMEAENRKVVAEVRALIDQGKNLYNNGRYEDAEGVLSRAQLRWQTTQTAEEPEIAYWLGFVRNALLVSSMREILVTDPLYTEMNQLLNLAREDYTMAQGLVTAGNRREALARLSSADEKISQVKRTFPYNQAASVLALRVSFLRDPPNSRQLFQTMFDSAVGKINTAPEETYNELRDLRQIDANFPGLNQAIYDVEIRLGIRRPPPDRRALAESKRLSQLAYGTVMRNETGQFDIALAQVNEALRLDPNNSQAIEIKTRLQGIGGSTVVAVLPSAAEEDFRRAQQLFSNQNYFEALAIVQRLLQTPAGRNYPPLEDLRRRIESQI